jgi:sporadic carbohydrate cluster protein (TIGR04323 family)
MIQKSKKSGFRGYIFSRTIDGSFIPHRVQNLVIKDYCQRKKLFFKLSATEYKMKDSYIMLNAVLKELNKIDGVVFYSVFMLPEDSRLRKKIYNLFLKSKKNLHFALEEIVLKNLSSLKEIENIIKINKNSKKI